uniref:ABC transporter ATP-binding protein n=1 Tax=Ningiella ruwaisensis TaxID=2364274 RepID=UPI0010A0A33A|nr:ATP-binding cassette domain-containing protein [Ningiella ruwaisensis]
MTSDKETLKDHLTPAIAFKELRFCYPNQEHDIISIDQWEVARGEQVFLSGHSGSGKSTLLNLICGALSPNSGEINLLDKRFSSLPSRERDKFRAKHIGVVFQQFNLIEYLSVAENVELAAYFGNTYVGDTYFGNNDTNADGANNFKSRLLQMCEAVKLPRTILNQSAGKLSVGQQQRVAIIRALINEPEIMIVDEPTSALDSNARDGFINLLMSLAGEIRSTLLFVSHDEGLAQHFSKHVSIEQINNVKVKVEPMQ